MIFYTRGLLGDADYDVDCPAGSNGGWWWLLRLNDDKWSFENSWCHWFGWWENLKATLVFTTNYRVFLQILPGDCGGFQWSHDHLLHDPWLVAREPRFKHPLWAVHWLKLPGKRPRIIRYSACCLTPLLNKYCTQGPGEKLPQPCSSFVFQAYTSRSVCGGSL